VAGLVCCANNDAAIEKLRSIERHSSPLPLTICVAGPQDVGRYAHISDLPEGLLQVRCPPHPHPYPFLTLPLFLPHLLYPLLSGSSTKPVMRLSGEKKQYDFFATLVPFPQFLLYMKRW
jgi:hypothetical protein